MCGIAGIFAYHDSAENVDSQELLRIRDHMVARGPDDAGIWYSDNRRVGLAHRRLSIIDPTPSGHQPMHRDGVWITYNGEIYNFRELKNSLESAGHKFHTQSDTEVLLALYQSMGMAMVKELVGMYAIAIWDSQKQCLKLARDPYGIKPLYYCDDGKQFRFASQVKALVSGGGVSKETDPASEVAFLMLGSVPEPKTFYSAISALPAGSSLSIDKSGFGEVNLDCSIAETWGAALTAQSGAEEDPIAIDFRNSVKRHLVSDVPVGVFLSAGIDSAAIAGLASETAAQKIDSITLRFDEFSGSENDESLLSSQVAIQYGLNHTIRTASRDEFDTDLPAFLGAMDQPTIDGLNTWYISKAAAEHGIKVMLSGLGGDELLGSYPSFERIPRWNNSANRIGKIPYIESLFFGLRKFVPHAMLQPKVWGLLKYGGNLVGGYFLNRGLFMPWELPELMNSDRLEAGLMSFDPISHIDSFVPDFMIGLERYGASHYHAAISSLESCLYMRNQLLRDTDWASMAHSVEVRTPLTDFQLFKSVAAKILGQNKSGSKLCLANAPQNPLPDTIKLRRKTGFTTPIGNWIESSPELDQWKSVSILARSNCHWSRRYAYSVLKGH